MTHKIIGVDLLRDDFGELVPGERPSDSIVKVRWNRRDGAPGDSVEITSNKAGYLYLAKTCLALAYATDRAESMGLHFHVDAHGANDDVDLQFNLLAE